MPLLPSETARAPSGGNGPRLPSPVTLTLDEVCASPEEKAKARKKAHDFFRLKVPAKKVAPAVRKVTKLRWHKTLTHAMRDARAQGKPILFIQALGDLKGFT